jgi:hypothetical protein
VSGTILGKAALALGTSCHHVPGHLPVDQRTRETFLPSRLANRPRAPEHRIDGINIILEAVRIHTWLRLRRNAFNFSVLCTEISRVNSCSFPSKTLPSLGITFLHVLKYTNQLGLTKRILKKCINFSFLKLFIIYISLSLGLKIF